MCKENKKPEVIDYDTFVHFVESSFLTDGPVRLTMPEDGSFKLDDKVTWSLSGKRPYPKLSTDFINIIDQRYADLKERYGYGGKQKAFDKLRQELINKGIDLEKHNIGYDYSSFDRAHRKRQKKER